MNIQSLRNYTGDGRRRAILVEAPLAASRGQSKELNKGGSPLAKIKTLGAIILLISAAIYLGSAAYREVEQARRMNEGHDRRLAQLEKQISRNSQQLSSLAQSNQDLLASLSLPTKLPKDFNSGVCLISGSYVFIDPNTGLPLRGMNQKKNESGEIEQPQFTIGGYGAVAEVFYEGTGFHVGNGYILTNRHVVVEPWNYDHWSKILSRIVSVQPHLVKLEAFFPGRRKPYPLTVERASSRDDIAVCKLSGADVSKEIPALPLDQGAELVKIGQAVTTIGFPAGVDRLLAVLSKEEAERLLEQYDDARPLLFNQLARRNLIKPLTSQGHVMDLHDDRIMYDAASGEGSSGAPVFGPSGRVIGVHFGFFEQNRLSNYAVPIDRGLALLRHSGWKPVINPGQKTRD